jgi:hypothetical protein
VRGEETAGICAPVAPRGYGSTGSLVLGRLLGNYLSVPYLSIVSISRSKITG